MFLFMFSVFLDKMAIEFVKGFFFLHLCLENMMIFLIHRGKMLLICFLTVQPSVLPWHKVFLAIESCFLNMMLSIFTMFLWHIFYKFNTYLYSFPNRYLVILSFHVFPDSLCTIGNILFLKYSTIILKQQKQKLGHSVCKNPVCLPLKHARHLHMWAHGFIYLLACSLVSLWRCVLYLLSQDGWTFGFHVISDYIERTFLNISLGVFVEVLRMNSPKMYLFMKN